MIVNIFFNLRSNLFDFGNNNDNGYKKKKGDTKRKNTPKKRFTVTFSYCTDTFHLLLTDHIHYTYSLCQRIIGKNIIRYLCKSLRMSEANEVLISSHIWVASTTFKQL